MRAPTLQASGGNPKAAPGIFEGVAVGDRIVEIDQRVGTSHIFDVNDLLFRLGQGVRLEQSQRFEIVAIIASGIQQAFGVGFVHFLPP